MKMTASEIFPRGENRPPLCGLLSSPLSHWGNLQMSVFRCGIIPHWERKGRPSHVLRLTFSFNTAIPQTHESALSHIPKAIAGATLFRICSSIHSPCVHCTGYFKELHYCSCHFMVLQFHSGIRQVFNSEILPSISLRDSEHEGKKAEYAELS